MKKHLILDSLVLVAISCAFLTAAAAEPPSGLQPPEERSYRNRFRLSYSMGFGVGLSFKNLGGFPAQTDPRTQAGVPHEYDDGYVRAMDGGNLPLPGTTEFVTTRWGYRYPDSRQITPGNASVLMHSYSSAAGASSSGDVTEPLHGFELSFHRQFTDLGCFRWGVEAAFGWMGLDVQDGRTLSAPVNVATDAYNLGGVLPPLPDPATGWYHGPTTRPGPLLGDTPTPQPGAIIPAGSPGSAVIAGNRKLEADLFGGRIGPYAEIPLNDRFSLLLSGGLAIVGVNSRFSFQESVTVPLSINPTINRSGSGSHGDVLLGGYIGGELMFAVSKSVDLSVSVRYQNVGTYTHTLSGKQAELDLGRSIFVSLGLGYSF